MTILDQQLLWNQESNATSLVTKFEDGSLKVEPLTSEEAALWEAENRY